MESILSRKHQSVLAGLAESRTVLAFDFDGTLAPIVRDRRGAALRRQTRSLLNQACALYPCAVISGRDRSDLNPRLNGIGVKYLIGNHGAELSQRLKQPHRLIAQAAILLREALRPQVGVEVESKRLSLAIHYRNARSPRRARLAALAAARGLPVRMREVGGKQVLNLLPPDVPHKGDAVLRLLKRERVEGALYVGDDTTDEDVFALDRPGLVTVRVGSLSSSMAAYCLRNQREVDRLLTQLVDLRRACGGLK